MKYLKIALLIILAAVTIPLLYTSLPVGLDWRDAYRPAALVMLHGGDPYTGTPAPFLNAPWTLLPFIPFALMPYQIGRVGIFIVGLAGFAYIAYKLKAKPLAMVIFLSSASVVGCLNNGNLDWLPMLSFVLPAPVGLLFAVMKPQVGIGVILYWLVMSYREGGVKRVAYIFAPVTILTLASFALYGFWFLHFADMKGNINNASLFPYGAIVGFVLMWLSLRKDGSGRYAMSASPFLAPYVSQFSWAAVLTPFFERPWLMAAVSAVLWVPVVIRVIA